MTSDTEGHHVNRSLESGSNADTKPTPELDEKVKEMKRREKRLSFVLSIVTGVFLICWTPTMIAVTINILCVSCTKSPFYTNYYFISSSTSAFNSVLNPIIYTVFVKEFRDAFKVLFKACFCRKRNYTVD